MASPLFLNYALPVEPFIGDLSDLSCSSQKYKGCAESIRDLA